MTALVARRSYIESLLPISCLQHDESKRAGEDRIMKRGLAFVVIVVAAILVALTLIPDRRPSYTSSSSPSSVSGDVVQARSTTYRVIHETGLYSSLSNEDPWQTLRVGTIVTPANGANTLSCTTMTTAGVVMEFCQVDVTETRRRGWVLKKWIEKQ